MRLLSLSIVCTLVVLAGCSGLSPGTDADGQETVNPRLEETPTRSPSPTAYTDPASQFNVTEFDATTLPRTHRQGLQNTSVTLEISRRVVADNGSVLHATTITSRSMPGEQLVKRTAQGLVVNGSDGSTTEIATWTNGSYTIRRQEFSNGTVTYRTWSGAAADNRTVDPTGTWAVSAVVSRFNLTRAGTVFRNGTLMYVLAAESTRSGNDTLRNISVWMLVTPDGQVRTYRVQYTIIDETGHRTVTEWFRVRSEGTTTVSRPEWVGDAIRSTVSMLQLPKIIYCSYIVRVT